MGPVYIKRADVERAGVSSFLSLLFFFNCMSIII